MIIFAVDKSFENMEKSTKDWVKYLSAVALIASAIAMGFLSFIITLDIGPGPLTYIGEALSAALVIFGLGVYVSGKVDDKFNDLKAQIHREVQNVVEKKMTDSETN